jgi:hypothetical protein
MGINTVQLPHARRQTTSWRLDKDVVEVVHQAVGVTKPAEARDYFTQGVQEQIAVGIIANDRLACIAAGGDVVNRTGELDSQRVAMIEGCYPETVMSIHDPIMRQWAGSLAGPDGLGVVRPVRSPLALPGR